MKYDITLHTEKPQTQSSPLSGTTGGEHKVVFLDGPKKGETGLIRKDIIVDSYIDNVYSERGLVTYSHTYERASTDSKNLSYQSTNFVSVTPYGKVTDEQRRATKRDARFILTQMDL